MEYALLCSDVEIPPVQGASWLRCNAARQAAAVSLLDSGLQHDAFTKTTNQLAAELKEKRLPGITCGKESVMELFTVWYECSFVGYCWAADEWSAIRRVAGELAYDGDGGRCFEYTATSRDGVLESA